MSSGQQQQKREELDARARQGETVVPGGTGGKSLDAQEHLAEGSHLLLLRLPITLYLFEACCVVLDGLSCI